MEHAPSVTSERETERDVIVFILTKTSYQTGKGLPSEPNRSSWPGVTASVTVTKKRHRHLRKWFQTALQLFFWKQKYNIQKDFIVLPFPLNFPTSLFVFMSLTVLSDELEHGEGTERRTRKNREPTLTLTAAAIFTKTLSRGSHDFLLVTWPFRWNSE